MVKTKTLTKATASTRAAHHHQSSSLSSSASALHIHHFFSAASYQKSIAVIKIMEEVWKDINLSSLQGQSSSRDDPNFSTTTFGGMIPPPPTMLTLNSGPEFHLFGNSNPLRQNQLLQPPISHACIDLNMQFNDGMGSCAGMNADGNGKKRCPEHDSNNNGSGDRRHKRMIKNRESAARSRARKQAYTNELELEVSDLMQENARLREQQRQLRLAAAGQQVPRKPALYRTSTAPF